MVQVVEIRKKATNRLPPDQYDDRLKQLRKESERTIKGMFEFLDAQGGYLEFSYRQFPGEPIMTMKIVHGEICDLPMGVVKQLNNTKKKVRRYNMVELQGSGFRGLPQSYDTVSRVRFTPMEVL